MTKKEELIEKRPERPAFIMRLSDGSYQLYLDGEKIPENCEVVAFWNGYEWIDFEKLKEDAEHEVGGILIDEWIEYIKNWIEKHIEDAKKNWKRYQKILDTIKMEYYTKFNIEREEEIV